MAYYTFPPPFYSSSTPQFYSPSATISAPLPSLTFSHGYTPPSHNPYTSSNPYCYGTAGSSGYYNTYKQQPTHPYSQHVGASQHSEMAISVFDGDEDAYGWVLCNEQYFKANGTPEEVKVTNAVAALRGRPLQWWLWWHHRRPKVDWDTFTTAFLWRFKPEFRDVLPILDEEEKPDEKEEPDLELLNSPFKAPVEFLLPTDLLAVSFLSGDAVEEVQLPHTGSNVTVSTEQWKSTRSIAGKKIINHAQSLPPPPKPPDPSFSTKPPPPPAPPDYTPTPRDYHFHKSPPLSLNEESLGALDRENNQPSDPYPLSQANPPPSDSSQACANRFQPSKKSTIRVLPCDSPTNSQVVQSDAVTSPKTQRTPSLAQHSRATTVNTAAITMESLTDGHVRRLFALIEPADSKGSQQPHDVMPSSISQSQPLRHNIIRVLPASTNQSTARFLPFVANFYVAFDRLVDEMGQSVRGSCSMGFVTNLGLVTNWATLLKGKWTEGELQFFLWRRNRIRFIFSGSLRFTHVRMGNLFPLPIVQAFDLEDKINLKGLVMIRMGLFTAPFTHASIAGFIKIVVPCSVVILIMLEKNVKAALTQKTHEQCMLPFLVRIGTGKKWDPGGHLELSQAAGWSSFKQWDPGKFAQGNFYNLEDKVVLMGSVLLWSWSHGLVGLLDFLVERPY